LRNWDEVYKNQKIILQTLNGIEKIFLAGGTAVQCYLREKMKENRCDEVDDYLVFYEENAFIEQECRDRIKFPLGDFKPK